MGEQYIKPEEAVTLHGLFLERPKRTPEGKAYRYFDTQAECMADAELEGDARTGGALAGRAAEGESGRAAIVLPSCCATARSG